MEKSDRILVTGANGHVGFNLIKALHDDGYSKLRASVRDVHDVSKTSTLQELGITDIVSLDIRDEKAFENACQDIDVLFHVAATYRYFTGGEEADRSMIDDSVRGVSAAMNAASKNGLKQVILTSSVVTLPYARPGEPLPDETMWRDDLAVPYMRAKVEGERLAWSLAEEHGISLATILPGPVLGPNFGKGTQSTDFIKGMMQGSMRMGTMDAVFAAIDVRDVARAHILAAEQGATGRFIVGADHNPTFPELLEVMRAIDPKVQKPLMTLPEFAYWMAPVSDWMNNKMLGTPRTLTRTFIQSLRNNHIAADNTKAKNELGWKPEVSLEECIRDTMTELKAGLSAA